MSTPSYNGPYATITVNGFSPNPVRGTDARECAGTHRGNGLKVLIDVYYVDRIAEAISSRDGIPTISEPVTI